MLSHTSVEEPSFRRCCRSGSGHLVLMLCDALDGLPSDAGILVSLENSHQCGPVGRTMEGAVVVMVMLHA
eukprot:9320179-Prorocentrum_lima.AAC.1